MSFVHLLDPQSGSGLCSRLLIKLLASIEEIKETQTVHSTMLQNLLRQTSTNDMANGGQPLPDDVEQMSDLDELEKLL